VADCRNKAGSIVAAIGLCIAVVACAPLQVAKLPDSDARKVEADHPTYRGDVVPFSSPVKVRLNPFAPAQLTLKSEVRDSSEPNKPAQTASFTMAMEGVERTDGFAARFTDLRMYTDGRDVTDRQRRETLGRLEFVFDPDSATFRRVDTKGSSPSPQQIDQAMTHLKDQMLDTWQFPAAGFVTGQKIEARIPTRFGSAGSSAGGTGSYLILGKTEHRGRAALVVELELTLFLAPIGDFSRSLGYFLLDIDTGQILTSETRLMVAARTGSTVKVADMTIQTTLDLPRPSPFPELQLKI
jgi:hypothetical protein